jgi:DNA-binding transcriptional MerR regulator
MPTIKIGQLARRASVTVDAIRFYERRGVLPRPQRRSSGHRFYVESDVERIRITKSLQALGFTLDEVIGSLRAFDAGDASCAGEQWRLQVVLDRIDAKLDEALRLRRALTAALASCRAGNCAVLPPRPHRMEGRRGTAPLAEGNAIPARRRRAG